MAQMRKDFLKFLQEMSCEHKVVTRADVARVLEEEESEVTPEMLQEAGDLNGDMTIDFMEYAQREGATPAMLATCADNPNQVLFVPAAPAAKSEVVQPNEKDTVPEMGCAVEKGGSTYSRPEIYSDDPPFFTICFFCCASLIIGLCIWGIVASLEYDTNPAEEWLKGSCYVVSIQDKIRGCVSCNTDTICGFGSANAGIDPRDGALCHRRRRHGTSGSRILNCVTRGGSKGVCETYKDYSLTMNVNSTDFTGTRTANKCGPKVNYLASGITLTRQGMEAAAWLDARRNTTVDCWYEPTGAVDSLSKSSVLLDKGCIDLKQQVMTVMVLCIVVLVLTLCCCLCAFVCTGGIIWVRELLGC